MRSGPRVWRARRLTVAVSGVSPVGSSGIRAPHATMQLRVMLGPYPPLQIEGVPVVLAYYANPFAGAQPIVLNPVGRCIYCGDITENLGVEHIFPEGLGGKLLLPKATCPCGPKRTHGFEGEAISKHFNQARKKLGIKGKNRKRPPNEALLSIWNPMSDQDIIGDKFDLPHYIDPIDHPSMMVVPRLFPLKMLGERILWNMGPTGEAITFDWWQIGSFDLSFAMRFSFTIDPLVRLLAKIAHAIAVSHYGYDSFGHTLIPIIDGDLSKYSDFIGEWPLETPSLFPFDYPGGLHECAVTENVVAGRRCIIVQIRLFSSLVRSDYPILDATLGDRLTKSYAVMAGVIF